MTWLRRFAICAVLVLAGCTSPAVSSGSGPTPPPSSTVTPATPSPRASLVTAGCGTEPTFPVETVAERELESGGVARSYRLGLPSGYDGSTRAPILIGLHGADESAAVLASATGLEANAWARGFVTVLPDAHGGVWNFEGATDLDLLDGILDAVDTELCVARERLFLAGFSQGGDFASFVACRLPGRAAAIAVAGVMNAYGPCPGWIPTPLLAMVGSNDPIYVLEKGLSDSVPFSGRAEDKPGPLDTEIGIWADANGCKSVPAATAGPGSAVTYSLDCPSGAGVRYLVHEGGHTWPGALTPTPPFLGPAVPDIDGTRLVLDFFEAVAA